MKVPRLPQIDILKGLAIIGVVILHTTPTAIQEQLWFTFYLSQSIPIFLILLGLNQAASLARAPHPLDYYQKQAIRLLPAYVLMFILSLVIGAGSLRLNRSLLLGRLPVAGPGNYFVSLLFQSMLLFPLLYRLYRQHPKLTVILCFGAEYIFQAITNHFPFPFMSYLLIGYLSSIGLGIWLNEHKDHLGNPPQIWWLGALSLFYLLVRKLGLVHPPLFFPNWPTQNIFSVFYPLILVIIGIKYLPGTVSNGVSSTIALIGKASYHIFLFQIVYFALHPVPKILDIVLCVVVGSIFYAIEKIIQTNFTKFRSSCKPSF